MKVLLIQYIYINKTININGIGSKLKEYYENNSRNTLKLDIRVQSIRVPYPSSEFEQAIKFVKTKLSPIMDVYIHLCNPKISHGGRKTIITYASTTNVIHEFGHALGLSHANINIVEKRTSCDPFDQMTIFKPYPSTNAVHREQLGWYLPGELLNCSSGTYKIGMLKNFADTISVKVLKCRKFYISYGNVKGINYVAVHTVYGKNSSFLIGMNEVVKGKVFNNKVASTVIEVLEVTPDILTLTLTDGGVIEEDDEEECSGMEDIDD